MRQLGDTQAQPVSTAELRKVLEDILSHHFGTRSHIAKLNRRPSANSSSFAVEELGVCLDDGTTLQLVFKNLGRGALLEGARQAKPIFLYHPLREIETYRTILAPNLPSTPTYYGAVIDHQIERYWLFLEKVPGVELYQVGEFSTWQQVARWLTVLHNRFARQIKFSARAQAAHLLSYDGAFYRLWLRRAQQFFRRAQPFQPDSVRHKIDWLAARYEQVVEYLVALPVTFVHGEFYASNVLVQQAAGEVRVCPVDWEMAAVGPGVIDLAALTAGKWSEAEKQALALTYHAALEPDGDWPPAPDEFLTALDYCHLHLAVQWLGWSPEWSPPREHAQDWLSEAMRLAERLML